MKLNIDYSLYLVTDSEIMSTKTVEESVERALEGGCTMVQLREKEKSSLDFYHTAVGVKKITDRYQVPLIINDRLDVAMAVDADGLHIGQKDLPAKIVRGMLGKDKILGVSVSSRSEAILAKQDGADYLGVGAMFTTNTKTDASLVSMEELKGIKEMVDLPIVVIGGIHKKTIPLFAGTGIDGMAVVSAIVSQKDVTLAARELKGLIRSTLQKDP